MSVYSLWDKELKDPKLKSSLSGDWSYKSPTATPRSKSPTRKIGDRIFNSYIGLIKSKSNISTEAKQTENIERPFDFFDDEEFAFGINLLKNNVACVGDNMTKLIQMAQEPWPDNVKLFQPYEVEQILLPDNASCLAVQAFLKMCNLPFEVEMRWNAEFMSPSGRVPFIKCGAFVVSELESIAQFAANKGVTLSSKLSSEERAEMRAYMSLITNVLINAELYISWLDPETFNAVTSVRNSSVYPWPLGWIQTRSKRAAVVKRLKALHWHDKTLDQVLADVEQCCNSLSQRLGDRDYFFGNPTPLDALLYGHIRAILSATGPKASLMIKPITSSLLRHVLRVSDLTGLVLTPQEEYLISQGIQICSLRQVSPDRSLVRSKRTKNPIRNIKVDNNKCNKDIFGFRPFASKEVIILSNKDKMRCQYSYKDKEMVEDKLFRFIYDILDEIIDKVDTIVTTQACSNEFEVITYPNDFKDIGKQPKEYLDTIEEYSKDVTEISDDTILEIDGDDQASNGMCDSVANQDFFDTNDINSEVLSEEQIKDDDYDSVTNKESRSLLKNIDYTSGNSDSTLKDTKTGDIDLDSLLECLRKRNAEYIMYQPPVDLD